MIRLEPFLWAIAALVINVLVIVFLGTSWQIVMLISVVIVVLYVLKQVFFAGFLRDYSGELAKRLGPAQASVFGMEWLVPLSDKLGKHCDMYVFSKHVVFVTPDDLGKKQAHVLELDLNDIEQVRLNRQGQIHINITEGAAKQLLLKSELPYDKLVRSFETLQAEIIHERKVRALEKVSAKAKQLDAEVRRKLAARRQVRVEKLQREGHELVTRFAEIVPEDILIKDSLFEKCKELIKLELQGRKSPLRGKLEEFLDNDFKPFAQIMREKAGFDFEDDEDLIILLKAIREEVRKILLVNFLARYSIFFGRLDGGEENEYIDGYIRLNGPGTNDLVNLEGFRLFLEKQGFQHTLGALTKKIENYLAKTEQDLKKHGLEKRINLGQPVIDDIGDVDILEDLEFAEFIKALLTKPEDQIEDIILGDGTLVEIVFNAGERVLVHVLRPAMGVKAEDIEKTEQAKITKGADVGMFITTSYLTNRAIELANDKGIIIWDRIRLKQEIELLTDR